MQSLPYDSVPVVAVAALARCRLAAYYIEEQLYSWRDSHASPRLWHSGSKEEGRDHLSSCRISRRINGRSRQLYMQTQYIAIPSQGNPSASA